MAQALTLHSVRELARAALAFGDERAREKSVLLGACAAAPIVDPAVLIAYHDCLLCLLAYPETRALRDRAESELQRVAQAAKALGARGSARERRALANSGIAYTPTTISFGWDIARWLVERFPDCAEIDSFGADDGPLPAIVAESLAPMEFELAATPAAPSELLEQASTGRRGTRLAWLVAAFARLPCSDALREVLFDAIQPYIVIEPRDTTLSRTFVRGLEHPAFLHRDGLARGIDLAAVLADPLAAARRLSGAERRLLIDAARAMLASLGRETDAIAATDAGGVAWHDVGRGAAIALYAMRAERRSPLDSHVGMMLFKNGIPVGYGGGWPFLGTCRIGVNIFAPFRGGESGFLFAQVLRVYRQRFAVGRFIAEPSQFGGSNKEGLLSGAFWFYYRLGFRPIDPRSAALAHGEWMRMREERGYRTPLAQLRRFTRSDIELRLDAVPDCEPAALSTAVTRWIDARFHGDRDAAEREAVRALVRALDAGDRGRWPEHERRAFVALAPLLAQIPALDRWPRRDQRELLALIRAKGADEFDFHRRLARQRRLADALTALARRAGA